MASKSSPAQTLFDRLIRTWIVPAANEVARQTGNSVVLRLALILWDDTGPPSVYFNEGVHGKVLKVDVISARPVKKGQPVVPNDIGGIKKVILRHEIHDKPYILIIQGKDQTFFVASGRMNKVVGNRDFELLREALATEGLQLTSQGSTFDIFLDVIRNSYDALPPALKRRETLQLARLEVGRVKENAVRRVKRHLRLPAFISHKEDEFLPLLIETRQTYIGGHYFSCIAAGVTTADRICNRLVHRYGLPISEERSIFNQTFGQKIARLDSRGLVTKDLRGFLEQMNRIRNRHLHPKGPLRAVTLKRDALRIVLLLHEVLDETFSVFRDYKIENGKFVAKRLV